jgi:hypothetical protein
MAASALVLDSNEGPILAPGAPATGAAPYRSLVPNNPHEEPAMVARRKRTPLTPAEVEAARERRLMRRLDRLFEPLRLAAQEHRRRQRRG